MRSVWRVGNDDFHVFEDRFRIFFADIDTLRPCMIKRHVAGISTLLEPSSTGSTTAAFTRLLGSTALGTLAASYRG